MEYQLRPAGEPDRTFLYDLHCTTMRRHIETTWGWDEIWQLSNFEQRFREKEISIIEVGACAAGALWIERRPESLYIADLQIMPDFQRRGIGTAVLKDLIREAGLRGVPLELVVLPVNEGAKRLYDRLGFKVTGTNEPFIQMRHSEPDPMR